MDSVWSYEKVFPNRYRLVAVDKVMGRGHTLRALWAPGYESRRLSDILQAAWYLNSNGKLRINVDDHQAAILEQIRRDAAGYGVATAGIDSGLAFNGYPSSKHRFRFSVS